MDALDKKFVEARDYVMSLKIEGTLFQDIDKGLKKFYNMRHYIPKEGNGFIILHLVCLSSKHTKRFVL